MVHFRLDIKHVHIFDHNHHCRDHSCRLVLVEYRDHEWAPPPLQKVRLQFVCYPPHRGSHRFGLLFQRNDDIQFHPFLFQLKEFHCLLTLAPGHVILVVMVAVVVAELCFLLLLQYLHQQFHILRILKKKKHKKKEQKK